MGEVGGRGKREKWANYVLVIKILRKNDVRCGRILDEPRSSAATGLYFLSSNWCQTLIHGWSLTRPWEYDIRQPKTRDGLQKLASWESCVSESLCVFMVTRATDWLPTVTVFGNSRWEADAVPLPPAWTPGDKVTGLSGCLYVGKVWSSMRLAVGWLPKR